MLTFFALLWRLLKRLLTAVQHPVATLATLTPFQPNPRRTLVVLARLAVLKHALWDYVQVRPVVFVLRPRFKFDCSASITWLYWCAGLRDPTGNRFSGSDTYTGSLLYHGRRKPATKVRAGDVCILGAELPTDEQHAIMALEIGPNPLCFSHGEQGDPHIIRASDDSRSKTWVSFDLSRIHLIRWPVYQ